MVQQGGQGTLADLVSPPVLLATHAGWLFADPHRHVPRGHQESSAGQLGLKLREDCGRYAASLDWASLRHDQTDRTQEAAVSNPILALVGVKDVVFHQNGEHLTNLWRIAQLSSFLRSNLHVFAHVSKQLLFSMLPPSQPVN